MTDSGWFIRDRGRLRGPFSQDQLVQMYHRGQLGRFHEISQDRIGWVKASSLLEELAPSPRAEARSAPARPSQPEPAPVTQSYSGESSSQWPVIGDESALAGDRPRSKSSNHIRFIAILSVPCVLIAAALTFVAFWNFRDMNRSIKIPISRTSSSSTIQSSTDSDGIAEAVGLVIVGYEFESSDGSHGEKPIMTGSCFAISKDGYLLTNRHVVEFADRLSRIKRVEDRAIQLARLVVSDMPNIKSEDKPAVAKVLAEKWNYASFEPKIWVFFTRRTKLAAKIVYLCDENEFDMAILKVDRTKGNSGSEAYFRLSSADRKIKLGDRIASLGFPAAERDTSSLHEKIDEQNRKALSSRIETTFKENDFTLSYYEGLVSKVYHDAHCEWISHSATVSHGNSGGPLVNLQGLVVGINTLADPANGIYKAISVSQLRDLVETQVGEGFVFSDR